MVNLRGEHWLNGPRTDFGSRENTERGPGMLPNGTMTSLPMPRLDNVTRSATQDYFDNTWTLTKPCLLA